MKTIVRKVTMWGAAIAVTLSLAGSAKAKTVQEVLDALYGAGPTTDYTLIAPNASVNFFPANTTIFLTVLESTANASFGFVRGSDSILLNTRSQVTPLSVNGFRIFAEVTGGELQTNVVTDLDRYLGSANDDVADSGEDFSASTALGSGGAFQFLLKTGSTFNPPANGGLNNVGVTYSSNAADRFTSADGEFKAYAINTNFSQSGADYTGGYFVTFEGLDANNNPYSFIAAINGVQNPEPASMAMIATGVLGMIGYAARRRRMAASTPVMAV